jgi:hypothetical protein
MASALKEYSIHHAICVENRLYSQTLSNRLGTASSPYLALYEEQPNFEYIFPFSCAAYYYLPKNRNPAWKTDARGIQAIYLGYGEHQGRKAYILCNPVTRTIHASVDVKVDPTYFPCRPPGYQRLDSWDSMHPHNISLHPDSPSIEAWINEDLLQMHHLNEPALPGENLLPITDDMFPSAAPQETIAPFPSVYFDEDMTVSHSAATKQSSPEAPLAAPFVSQLPSLKYASDLFNFPIQPELNFAEQIAQMEVPFRSH